MSDDTSERCPSDLALEGLLSGDDRAAHLHVQSCARCKGRIDEMEANGAQYRRVPGAIRARRAFEQSDRRWKSRMALAALVPAVAAAAAVGVLPRLARDVPSRSVIATPQRSARTVGRGLLEPRGGGSPVRLREIRLRGRTIGFGQGALEAAADNPADPARPFTLKHTDVDAQVSAFVARVQVTQEFVNPFGERVEAVYVFPLPDNAAVDDMTLVVGDRVIRGVIQRREEARRTYERAKSEGRHAALLDEERPNIFTQSVANVPPGETVKVVLSYVAPLRYDDGSFEFNFPMVVGPRYVPGHALAGARQGTGVSPDTDVVLDASRITPASMPAGERPGRDIAVHLHVDAGLPIEDLSSVSHRLHVTRPSPREADLELAADDRVPNKDLIVRWKIAGPELRSAILATRGEGGGYFALLVQPESLAARTRVVPKEMVFVIDTSGSMVGAPLAAEKAFMRRAISSMGPEDTFYLVDFADRASSFHPSALANTPGNVERVLSYLAALPAGGCTNQLEGIRIALNRPQDPKRLRVVLFLTDGFIGNEAEVLAAAQTNLAKARIFALGVGSSVNHYLLTRLADVGKGFYQYLRPDEDQSEAIERFVRRIARPLITDIEINWGGLAVSEVLPRKVPDVFDHQPLIVLGKYSSPGQARVVVHGLSAGDDRKTLLDVVLPDRSEQHAALATLWARSRIEELERQLYQGEKPEIIRQIQSLGLEHRLVTRYTSFVAADQRPSASTGASPRSIAEPVPIPDGVTMAGTAGSIEGALKGSDGAHSASHRIGAVAGMGFKTSPLIGNPPIAMAGVGFGPPVEDALGAGSTRPIHAGGGIGAFAAGGVGRGGGEGRAAIVSVPRRKVSIKGPGALARELISKVFEEHMGEVRGCYERALLKDPSVAGMLVLEWKIDANGRVHDIKIKQVTLRGVEVTNCLAGSLASWAFPRPSGGEVVVSQPFLFNAVVF